MRAASFNTALLWKHFSPQEAKKGKDKSKKPKAVKGGRASRKTAASPEGDGGWSWQGGGWGVRESKHRSRARPPCQLQEQGLAHILSLGP